MSANFIDIVCDQHKRDHFVTRYEHRWEDGTPMGEAAADWRELPPATARQRREHAARPRVEGDDLGAAILNAPPTGKGSTVWLAGDELVDGRASTVVAQFKYQQAQAGALYRDLVGEKSPEPPAEQRTVHPNQCTRCSANAPLRGENMGALLDGFAKMGRTRVTLRELNDAARRVRVRRNSAEF